jgi:hypothetical protein
MLRAHLPYLRALACLWLLLSSCSLSSFMTEVDGDSALAAPPPGKAIVNFHRPDAWAARGLDYSIFDREKLIGSSRAGTWFQYVCEPGEHLFLGTALLNSAVRAQLDPDRVYDILITVGFDFRHWHDIELVPITRSHPEFGRPHEWEVQQQLRAFEKNDYARTYEQSRASWAHQAIEDFEQGSDRPRLRNLERDDYRDAGK